MSKLSDRRRRKDQFHRRAAKGGFKARSIFKLEEIDAKLDLIPRGARVLDLGCAPGSWLQYASQKAGPGAHLVGVDRGPIELSLPNFRMVVGDVHEIEPAELVGDLAAFDVVLSDMAPDTTGIRHVDQARSEALFERALDLANEVLAPGGNFLAKIFQGPAFQSLVQRCRAEFDKVKMIKPEGSKRSSLEQYVAARGFRGGL
jgi:23S rRNA (uridine2552-2'-O)-methyltransferase